MSGEISVEDQFHAAVQIIRKLPKSGSFSPPYTLQLALYSYYKQATVGPCTAQRPSLFDIVGRAKFESWKSLGSMDTTTAMKNYVHEFVSTVKKLRETATPEEVKQALTYAEPKHIALFMPLFSDCDLPPEFNNALVDRMT